jgi:hypothetical protein
MNVSTSLKGGMAVLAVAVSALLPNSAAAQSTQAAWETGKWQFSAILYAYLPTIDGSLTIPPDPSSPSINVDAGTIIDNLKFTFMGTFDAHNGRWGVFTDLLYLDVGGDQSKTRDLTIAGGRLPASATADLSLDLKGTVWTIAGEYRVISDPAWTMDVLAGARLFNVKPTIGWSLNGDLGPLVLPSRSGGKEESASNWDAIVGVKGAYRFGQNRDWYVPYYLDVGTGQSDLTWQGMIGLGYSFKWGDLLAAWRYLDYNFKSGESINDMNFNGPMFGVAFHW